MKIKKVDLLFKKVFVEKFPSVDCVKLKNMQRKAKFAKECFPILSCEKASKKQCLFTCLTLDKAKNLDLERDYDSW